MPTGTGAVTLQTIPVSPFVTDPDAFFGMTEKNVQTVHTVTPGAGKSKTESIPQVGIIAKLLITFVGQLVVTTAAATTGDRWPYGILSNYLLSANATNDLWSCDGIDLQVLRFLRYPAYREFVDQFPDVVGGGGAIAVGTYPLYLTFEVPIAVDEYSLVASLFAQSSAVNIRHKLTQATSAELFTANPANAAITGDFFVESTTFEVPFDGEGRMVIPDLSRLHGFNSFDTPISNVGDARTEVVRSDGQLLRLFVSARNNPTSRLSAAANAASTKKLETLRIQYGGNQRPLEWDPASKLLARNGMDYGAPLPYDRLAVDNLKENPARDLFLLQGVTELVAVPRVGAGVTVAGGSVRLVQETLF
jgi:hypothetical protein